MSLIESYLVKKFEILVPEVRHLMFIPRFTLFLKSSLVFHTKSVAVVVRLEQRADII